MNKPQFSNETSTSEHYILKCEKILDSINDEHSIALPDFMEMLRNRHELATATFGEDCLHPLEMLLVYFVPTLMHVKEIFTMYPSALMSMDFFDPTHSTLDRSPKLEKDVFLFFVEKHPTFLSDCSHPLDFFISEHDPGVSFEVIEFIFRQADKCFEDTKTSIIDPDNFLVLLEIFGENPEQLHFLLERIHFAENDLEAPYFDLFFSHRLTVHLCRLTSLSIHEGATREALQLLAHNLCSNTSIKKLYMDVPSLAWGDDAVDDAYAPIKDLIRINTAISVLGLKFCSKSYFEGFTFIHVAGDECVLPDLEEAFFYNTTLSLLSIHHDTRDDLIVSSHMKNAVYYVRLNACGRGKLRRTATTMEECISMLCPESIARQMPVGDGFKIMRLAESSNEVHQIQFGLLREMPGLWCNGNPLKRKRKSTYR